MENDKKGPKNVFITKITCTFFYFSHFLQKKYTKRCGNGNKSVKKHAKKFFF